MNRNLSRNIDAEVGRSYSWMGERFRLVKLRQVNIVAAMLIIAFFAGALSSIIWLQALDVFVYGGR